MTGTTCTEILGWDQLGEHAWLIRPTQKELNETPWIDLLFQIKWQRKSNHKQGDIALLREDNHHLNT